MNGVGSETSSRPVAFTRKDEMQPFESSVSDAAAPSNVITGTPAVETYRSAAPAFFHGASAASAAMRSGGNASFHTRKSSISPPKESAPHAPRCVRPRRKGWFHLPFFTGTPSA